jgi:carbon-monoxide dehydrogenase medium subunit
MQVPSHVEYERARSVDHALELLARFGPESRVLAGGHSLIPMMKLRLAQPETLIDINGVSGLSRITVTDGELRIGALVRHAQLLASPLAGRHFPILHDAEQVIADPIVRNWGTIGGSLCQADPAEDLTTVCAVLGAVCVARGPSGKREIAVDDFLQGPYETSLAHNEMLVEVRIPVRHNTSSAYAKVERRVGDWAVTAAGAQVTLDGDAIVAVRIGLTAVNPDADALAAASQALVGMPATEETFAGAGRAAAQACEPVCDMRGTVDYKRHLASELTIRTLRSSVERIRNTPEPQGN